MKNIVVILAVVLIATIITGCKSGDWNSEMGPRWQNPSVFDGQHPLGVAQTNVVEAVKR